MTNKRPKELGRRLDLVKLLCIKLVLVQATYSHKLVLVFIFLRSSSLYRRVYSVTGA
jgi:hypothetical protein